MGEEQKQPIIVKKVKKVVGGHHGGAWKVAFADFMTAMMAFFLVMWLVATMVPVKKRVMVAGYFKYRPILHPNGNSILDDASTVKRGVQVKQPPPEHRRVFNENPDDLMRRLKEASENELQGFKENLSISMTSQGIRVDISDVPLLHLFLANDAMVTPDVKEIIRVIASVVSGVNNKLVIESHVNSVSQSPWELTTARAMGAYNTFTDFGVDPGRFVRVAGCGFARPASDDGQDIRNNRLSLQILFVTEDN